MSRLTGKPLWAYGLLIVLGAGWGLTQPLTKIAVSTGHSVIGMIFWQGVIGALFIGLFLGSRNGTQKSMPKITKARLKVWAVIAGVGTLIPSFAGYTAITYIPSGAYSLLLALIPMMAFPIALFWGLERFEARRFAGIALGLVGVLIMLVPSSTIPDTSLLGAVGLALIAPLCYAFETPIVGKFGTAGMSALEVLLGASVMIALVLAVPVFAFDAMIDLRVIGVAEVALIASCVIHVLVYATFIWLIGITGAVFAVQVSYLVTFFGVIWAMLILGERFDGWFWVAMGITLLGVFLVQPKRESSA